MSEILDKLPVAAELVAKDLAKGTKATKAGRAGMSGEQVLRAGMLKQMHCWSYEDLAFHLSDSPPFRTFCRGGMMQSAPKRSALAQNIKRVLPEYSTLGPAISAVYPASQRNSVKIRVFADFAADMLQRLRRELDAATPA